MVRNLPSGGYVIAQDMGGLVKTFVVKPPTEPPQDKIDPYAGVATLEIPMLYCGRIMTPRVKDGEKVKVHLTKETLRRQRGYDDDKADGASEQSFQRFRVGYHAVLSEFVPKNSGAFFYTQYVHSHPTWWSGAMAEVVQIVSGFGSQDKEDLPEEERKGLPVPAAVQARMEREKEHINVRLPGYTGKPPKDGQLRYNYKFDHTDVVSFDSEGSPWLVQIKRDGVWAMPLPLIPATTTKTFKKWVGTEEDWSVSDPELEHIIERFGGIPSGETMPFVEKDFKAWERAGVIIKVCEVGDFYDHIMYSSACGWSVNSKGTEGFNTCYDYDDNGFGVGFAYKLKLSLGAAKASGKLPEGLKVDDPQDSALLNKYLSGLYRQLRESSAKNLAIKYKVRREGADKILSRAQGAEGEADVDYWDNLKLDPIASHTGSIKQVGNGNLYHPSKFEFNPQLKFPEPFMVGCISHDFRALPESAGKPKPKCDTIMFGYYVKDDLKVVKYFYEPKTTKPKVEGDLDPCTGEGSQTTTSEGVLLPYFHTTDFDDRETTPDSVTEYEAKVSDLGYDPTPRWDFILYWMPGSLSRNRNFRKETDTQTSEGRSVSAGLCVPYLTRNALLYAYSETDTGGSRTKTDDRFAVPDPYSYRIWTYDWIFHWAGSLPVMKGSPFPKNGFPVWAEIEDYNPTPCSDLADSGPWIESFPTDVTPMMPGWQPGHLTGPVRPPNPYPAVNVTQPKDAEEKRRLHFSIDAEPYKLDQDKSNIDSWYFVASPSDFLGVFYREATKNVCGKAEYSIVSEPFGKHTKWGKSSYADDKTTPRFIGVIHE